MENNKINNFDIDALAQDLSCHSSYSLARILISEIMKKCETKEDCEKEINRLLKKNYL